MTDQAAKEGSVRVRLETSGLPDAAVEQINQALQKTLVTQLAELAVMQGGRIDLGLPNDKSFSNLFSNPLSDIFTSPYRTDGIVARFPAIDLL